MVNFESDLNLIYFATTVEQTVVKHLICLDSRCLHCAKGSERGLNVLILTKAFDHGAVRDKVRSSLGKSVLHLFKKLLGSWNIKTTDANVYERVIGDSVWNYTRIILHLVKHFLVERVGFVELPLLSISLDHGSIQYGVHWNLVLLHTIEHLNRSLDVRVFNTSVQKTAVSHTVWS